MKLGCPSVCKHNFCPTSPYRVAPILLKLCTKPYDDETLCTCDFHYGQTAITEIMALFVWTGFTIEEAVGVFLSHWLTVLVD